jgi:phosphatidylinositol-3-phosphatase
MKLPACIRPARGVARRVRWLWRSPLLAALVMLSSCAVSSAPSDKGSTVGPGSAPTATVTGPPFSHVFIIVMENTAAGDIYSAAKAPYINGLGAHYAQAMQYFAVSHPSLPNYLALTAGTPNPLDGTDCSVGPTCHVAGTHTNIADEIEASGRSWVAYMESMPSPCWTSNAGTYAVRHDPFVYFDDLRNGPNARCAKHVLPYDAAAFATQLQSGNVPDYVWITPNLCDDGHDTCGGDPIEHQDAWLARTVPLILSSQAFQRDGVLFITWDEGVTNAGCCGQGQGGGPVALFAISPLAKPGLHSTQPFNHYSLLRTIEVTWGLGQLANTNPAIAPATNTLTPLFNSP